jgi:hypothetical protein
MIVTESGSQWYAWSDMSTRATDFEDSGVHFCTVPTGKTISKQGKG